MDVIVCPHCNAQRIVTTDVPQDVVAVMPCPACNELSVLFRGKVIPLNRQIIEEGSFEERKTHLSEVIAEFLEAGLLASGSAFNFSTQQDEDDGADNSNDSDDDLPIVRPPRRPRRRKMRRPNPIADIHDEGGPISDQEFDQFVRFDLRCIDDPAYFKKHFG